MRTTPIEVYIKEDLSKGWELGLWELPESKRLVWGLVCEGRRTHMCYDLEHYETFEQTFTRRKNKFEEDQNQDWLLWFFDAGGNGRPVTVTLNELERACKVLGIWELRNETEKEKNMSDVKPSEQVMETHRIEKLKAEVVLKLVTDYDFPLESAATQVEECYKDDITVWNINADVENLANYIATEMDDA